MLSYASVCSGIEAATVAWHPLGLSPSFFSETDAFCSAVLAHHWPEIPNLGDFTTIGPERGPVDILVGGPPCQAFSAAGGRAGLRDPRGQLALEFLLLAARLQAKWVVFENVPGLLSSGQGEGWLDFGTFLGAMGELGYGFAYRVLDARHFGVPQRRRRVFVVGRVGGDWRASAAVLFERESLRGVDPPSRTEGTGVAGTIAARAPGRDPDFSGPGNLIYNVQPLSASVEPNTLVARETGVAEALTAMGPQRRCDRGDLVVMPIQGVGRGEGSGRWGSGVGESRDPSYTLTTRGDAGIYAEPISFDPTQVTHPENRSKCEPGEDAPTLARTNRPHVAHRSSVRRLTPLEYERLQGFPEGHTLVPWRGKPAADGNRYKAVGNSMAVPVMRWIGRRLLMVDEILKESGR